MFLELVDRGIAHNEKLVHTVGAPLAHSFEDYVPKAWIPYSSIPELQRENVTILQGTAVKADPALMSVTYMPETRATVMLQTMNYDYLVVASGLLRPWPVVPSAITKSQYSADATRQISKLANSEAGIVVVGGGQYCVCPYLALDRV